MINASTVHQYHIQFAAPSNNRRKKNMNDNLTAQRLLQKRRMMPNWSLRNVAPSTGSLGPGFSSPFDTLLTSSRGGIAYTYMTPIVIRMVRAKKRRWYQ